MEAIFRDNPNVTKIDWNLRDKYGDSRITVQKGDDIEKHNQHIVDILLNKNVLNVFVKFDPTGMVKNVIDNTACRIQSITQYEKNINPNIPTEGEEGIFLWNVYTPSTHHLYNPSKNPLPKEMARPLYKIMKDKYPEEVYFNPVILLLFGDVMETIRIKDGSHVIQLDASKINTTDYVKKTLGSRKNLNEYVEKMKNEVDKYFGQIPEPKTKEISTQTTEPKVKEISTQTTFDTDKKERIEQEKHEQEQSSKDLVASIDPNSDQVEIKKQISTHIESLIYDDISKLEADSEKAIKNVTQKIIDAMNIAKESSNMDEFVDAMSEVTNDKAAQDISAITDKYLNDMFKLIDDFSKEVPEKSSELIMGASFPKKLEPSAPPYIENNINKQPPFNPEFLQSPSSSSQPVTSSATQKIYPSIPTYNDPPANTVTDTKATNAENTNDKNTENKPSALSRAFGKGGVNKR